MSKIIIRTGDSLELLKKVHTKSVDLVVTSPPYNLGMDYEMAEFNDDRPWKEYYQWCQLWMTEVFRVLKDDGRFALNHYLSCGDKRGRTAPLMNLNAMAEEIGFKHHGLAVWDERTISRLTAWGSYLSASAPYINSPFEGILLLYKDSWKKLEKGESTIAKDEFIAGCSGIWKIPPVKRKEKKHPAAFPVELPMLIIKLLSYKGDVVLDPFMGTGTTMVAAKRLKRNGVGFELNPKYAKMAMKWVEEDHGTTEVFRQNVVETAKGKKGKVPVSSAKQRKVSKPR